MVWRDQLHERGQALGRTPIFKTVEFDESDYVVYNPYSRVVFDPFSWFKEPFGANYIVNRLRCIEDVSGQHVGLFRYGGDWSHSYQMHGHLTVWRYKDLVFEMAINRKHLAFGVTNVTQ